jgi:hypothetical protein
MATKLQELSDRLRSAHSEMSGRLLGEADNADRMPFVMASAIDDNLKIIDSCLALERNEITVEMGSVGMRDVIDRSDRMIERFWKMLPRN